jgi:hypothetical protein
MSKSKVRKIQGGPKARASLDTLGIVHANAAGIDIGMPDNNGYPAATHRCFLSMDGHLQATSWQAYQGHKDG